MTDLRWIIHETDPALCKRLVADLRLSPVTAQVLINRGMKDSLSAKRFMQPSLEQLSTPLECAPMNAAAEIVARAVADREPILIYGDYDADGVCAVALMLRLFSLLGVKADFYIPDRASEGYGLNSSALELIASRGHKLIITVDCGTTAVDEAKLAQDLGMRLIITDHHQPSQILPPACAIVNPHLAGQNGFDQELSGVGVAFKLAFAILSRFGKRDSPHAREFLSDALALVALGTVADVVPLRGENRALTQFGLAMLRQSQMPGIQALISVSGLSDRSLTSEDLAFRLGPRINAAGRLQSAHLALELLMTDSPSRAWEIAALLDRINRERQKLESEILDQAHSQLEGIDLSQHYGIVLSDPQWHPGVIGIVASKLAEHYYRPVVLICRQDEICQGSARSIPGFHLFEALKSCSSALLSFGGHAQAAGLRLRHEMLERFSQLFGEAARRALSPEDLMPVLNVDAKVDLSDVTAGLVAELDRLAPFGQGNPQPLLAAYDLLLGGRPRRMGREGKHLSFFARQADSSFRVVAFGMGELAAALDACRAFDLAFTPQINTYRGNHSLELNAQDIRLQRT